MELISFRGKILKFYMIFVELPLWKQVLGSRTGPLQASSRIQNQNSACKLQDLELELCRKAPGSRTGTLKASSMIQNWNSEGKLQDLKLELWPNINLVQIIVEISFSFFSAGLHIFSPVTKKTWIKTTIRSEAQINHGLTKG